MLLPGITVNTSPTDFAPIKQLQMMRFTGERWERFGAIINGALGGTRAASLATTRRAVITTT